MVKLTIALVRRSQARQRQFRKVVQRYASSVCRFASTSFFAGCVLSCSLILGEDDKLTLEKRENKTGRLKLSGYYHTSTAGKDDSIVNAYFLYRTGELVSAGAFPQQQVSQREDQWRSPAYWKKLQPIKETFGVYQITEDSICFENGIHLAAPPKPSSCGAGLS